MAWPRDGFAESPGRDAQRMGTSCGARGAGRATPRYLLKVCLRACVDRDVFDSALGAWGRGGGRGVWGEGWTCELSYS